MSTCNHVTSWRRTESCGSRMMQLKTLIAVGISALALAGGDVGLHGGERRQRRPSPTAVRHRLGRVSRRLSSRAGSSRTRPMRCIRGGTISTAGWATGARPGCGAGEVPDRRDRQGEDLHRPERQRRVRARLSDRRRQPRIVLADRCRPAAHQPGLVCRARARSRTSTSRAIMPTSRRG